MNKRQLGKFRISVKQIEDSNPNLWKIFSSVIPIRAESMYHTDCIEYVALSHSFSPVGLGHIIPWYKAVFNEYGELTWEPTDE